ncbi:ribosome recycling factor [bacterium]|nr:ribosome recycling factor [bacterium]
MIDDVLAQLKSEIEETAGRLKKDLAKLRTGRASAALLDGIMVDYYGARTHLNQLASVNVPEARLIVVTPYDKGAIGEIEKAIKGSDLGLNPQNDGKIVRIPIPELTEQRRRDLVKHVRKVGEEYRVSMRNHRRDANEMLKELLKEKEIGEDDHRHGHDKVQGLTDAGIEKVEQILKSKEDEIMTV